MAHGMRRVAHGILGLGAALGVAACTSTSMGSIVRTHETPSAESAYIYGRFALATKGLMFLEPGAVGEASLVMKCDSGEELSIAFLENNATQMLQLKPSRCALVEIVFKNAIGVTLDSRATRVAEVKFDLAAGKAYYIGDWKVDVDRVQRGGRIHSSMKWGVSDHYQATTNMVNAGYPLFAAIPTEHLFRPRVAEDFVNCVSKGERTWTYRSQCD